MQMNGERVFTAVETAAKLGITADTLKGQRQKGRIHGIKISSRDYVYSASEIRRYQIEIQQPAGKRSAVSRRKLANAMTTEYDHSDERP